ncbi:MAG: PLP-dependent aminotransferase family protein [Nocardioidaceae bacterium]
MSSWTRTRSWRPRGTSRVTPARARRWSTCRRRCPSSGSAIGPLLVPYWSWICGQAGPICRPFPASHGRERPETYSRNFLTQTWGTSSLGAFGSCAGSCRNTLLACVGQSPPRTESSWSAESRRASHFCVECCSGDGKGRLAVEDPSNAVQRQLLGRLGMETVDVPVDDCGLQVDALAASGARAVLCTPAHQYPCGVALSPARREQLLRWAGQSGGLIIEDDYDAEFRYERAPLGCLQGMDSEHVALLGSVSKTLAPALRIGWVLTPPLLLPALRELKRDDDFGSNSIAQHVLAYLLKSGLYDRHLRGLRRRYRQRRDAFLQAIGHHLPDWQVMGSAGGLHLAVALPPDVSERRLVAAAAGQGLSVLGLEAMSGSTTWGAGIVVSYARATPDMCDVAVRRLAAAAQRLDQVTPEMEATAARESILWHDLGVGQ